MSARPSNRPRPRSTAAPSPQQPIDHPLRRKYSLDHGEPSTSAWRGLRRSPSEVTRATPEDSLVPPSQEAQENTLLANGNVGEGDGKDENHNMPLEDSTQIRCNSKVLKKQTSFESIGCDDNYFYDFFDRNCRPPTPVQSQTTSEDTPNTNPAPTTLLQESAIELENKENNNPTEPCRIELESSNTGASSRVRRNVNVRPRSWLTTTSTGRVEDCRRIRRRQTDPCGRDFLSNYERALSSLLYQPYECRTQGPSISSNFDDSDVGYWLSSDSSSRWNREPERRDCCYSSSSSSSLSSSSSSLGEFMRRKWGSSKDPSSSSIRALLSGRSGNTGGEKVGNAGESSDLNLPPQGALVTGSCAQSTARHGGEMLVNVAEPEIRGSQSDLLANNLNSGEDCNSGSVGVSVNCYRAVPATVSSVPTIPCNNNVSNVRIVQTTRTFTSTEAQTDDVIVDQIRSVGPSRDREQRRRERRERRHQRRIANHLHPHQTPDPTVWHTPLPEPVVDRLPDILNSHLPPPYSTLPLGMPPPLPPSLPPPIVTTVPGSPPPQPAGLRFPFAIVPAGRRRSRLSPHFTADDQPKSCCGVAVSQTLTIRWFIILIFLVGLCCAVVGTVLGAMKATGREHLTVSLLMIGVGIVLVAVSGVAWRLTSQQAPSCRAMLGLGGDDSTGEPNRRFVPRLPPSYGRPHHPYAAMMYPEFQYRAPPPSYQASMQEYRLRLLLLDRHTGTVPGNTVSPPPTYRSQAGSLLRAPIGLRGRETHTPSQSEYSRPPSYRSRTSSRPDPSQTSHSREPSGSDPGQAVNVITVHPHIIKLAPSPPLPAKGGKDSNLVTIVQTASQPTGPVIVTISGQEDGSTSHCQQSEMEILAHL